MESEQPVVAIPTSFEGVQMRSRLEGQTAAFFSRLGWKWEYERFDLTLPSGRAFKPDFFVFDTSLVVECRGYSSAHGDSQILEFAELIQHTPYNKREPFLELSKDYGEADRFLVIGPVDVRVYVRDVPIPLPGIFGKCPCGEWDCLTVPGHIHSEFKPIENAFSLSLSDHGKLLINGKPLEDC